MNKFSRKQFVIMSLILSVLILIGFTTILLQQSKRTSGALLGSRTENRHSLNKDTGAVLDPENLPKGLVLYE